MHFSEKRLDDLAVLSGKPLFDRPLHVGGPNLGDRKKLLARIEGMLDRGWLTNHGPLVQELEQRLAALLEVRHVVAVCNGTMALCLAAHAAGLSGEVIVPSFTFVATAHALQWLGIRPVFCDIEPATGTLDPARVEELVTPRTTGIVGVHLWGTPCLVEPLEEIANRRGLTLLFDAAHALLCSHRGRWVGGFGLAECFSFHPTKFFNTFEGGAVTTQSDDLARRLRLMRNFGFQGYDTVLDLGINGKMPEVCAAMGLTGLESLDDFIETNRRNLDQYQSELQGVPGISLRLSTRTSERRNFQYVPVELDERRAGLSRDDLVAVLHAENVLVRRYFWPGAHAAAPYRSIDPHAGDRLPVTRELASRIVMLPTGTTVDPDRIRAICALIRVSVGNGPALKEHLRRRASS